MTAALLVLRWLVPTAFGTIDTARGGDRFVGCQTTGHRHAPLSGNIVVGIAVLRSVLFDVVANMISSGGRAYGFVVLRVRPYGSLLQLWPHLQSSLRFVLKASISLCKNVLEAQPAQRPAKRELRLAAPNPTRSLKIMAKVASMEATLLNTAPRMEDAAQYRPVQGVKCLR